MASTPAQHATNQPKAPPELVSEHGKGMMVVVKAHTRTPAKKKAPVPTPRSAATGPPADPIGDQVTAAQLPAQQQITDNSAASAAAAKAQAATTEGYYQALASILQGISPQVQGVYQSAAADTSAFGKGFSDGLAHVQSQNDSQANYAAGISGGSAPPASGPSAADALYNIGGYIPSTSLAREGAGFASAAALYPGTAAGQGAATIQGIGQQQAVDQRGFAQQRSDLAAQVPGLRAQYQATADANARADRAFNYTVSKDAAHEADVLRQQKISYILATGIDPATGKLTPKAQAELARAEGYDPVTGLPTAATTAANARVKIAQTNANTAASRLTLAQQKQLSDLYGVDANGNLTLAGRKAALAQWKAEHPKKTGGYTDAQKSKLQDSAAKLADRYYYGTPDTTTSSGVKPGIPAIADYQKALKLELSHGVPLEYALKALNALYPIGQEGRPWVDVAGRWLLQQAGIPMTNPEGMPSVAQAKWLNAHGYPYNGPIHDVNPSTNPNAAGPPR